MRGGEASDSYPPALSLPRQALFARPYVEPLSDARTKPADFFSILLESFYDFCFSCKYAARNVPPTALTVFMSSSYPA